MSLASLASEAETISGVESDGAGSSQAELPLGQFKMVKGKQRKRRRLEAERLTAGLPVKPADAKRLVSGRLASPTCSGTLRLLPRNRGAWAILSLNVNRMASLGGLVSILRSVKPDLVFLQECTLRDASLRARAASLGYVAHQSSLDPTRPLRQLVTWVKRGLVASVSDLIPGNLQGVKVGDLYFLHVHAPLDSHPEDRVMRA